MARTQNGSDYVLFLNTGTTELPAWKIALCQTTLTANFPKDVTEANSKCGNDFMVDHGIETIDVEGYYLQDDISDTQKVTSFELHQMADAAIDNDQPIEFKLGPKGETMADDGKVIYDGIAYITNISDSFPNKEKSTVSFTLQVKGRTTLSKFAYTT